MSIPFNPKEQTYLHLIDGGMLSCDAENPLLLRERAKETHSLFTRFIFKIIHWFTHPNERIANVSEVFNRILAECNLEATKPAELANLHANCSFFNNRVIKQHNDSWITCLLFWNYVPTIDEDKLEVIGRYLWEGEQNAKAEYAALKKDLNTPTCTADLSQRMRDISTHHFKFISLDEQRSLQHDYDAYVKTRVLNSKVLKAEFEHVSKLRAEVERELSLPGLSSDNRTFLQGLQKKLDLIERMHRLFQQWKELASESVVTEDMRSRYSETMSVSCADMSSNPYVVSVQSEAKAIFSKIEKHAMGLASWRAYFANQTAMVSRQAETDCASMTESFAESAAFNTFIKEMPESKEKNELVQQAQAYEALLADVSRFKQANEQVLAFRKKLCDDYKLSKKDFDEYKALKGLYNFGVFLRPFQTNLERSYQVLLNKARERLKKLDEEATSIFPLSNYNLDALCEKEDQLISIQHELDSLAAVYSDRTISQQNERLARLKKIIAEYPAFKTSWQQFQETASAEIATYEAAVNILEILTPTAAEVEHPALVTTLGVSHHPAIQPFLHLRLELSDLRAFLRICFRTKPLIDSYSASMTESDQLKLAAFFDESDSLLPCFETIAPKVVAKYQAMRQRFAEFRAFRSECKAVLNVLTGMSERPDAHKKELSLHFFQSTKGKPSRCQRTRQLLQNPLTSTEMKNAIQGALNMCFPEAVYHALPLVEKCSQLWKTDAPPVFNDSEFTALEALAKTPGLPLILTLQFELLITMHRHKFHPKAVCPVSMSPLTDPVVTLGDPRRYYDRQALQKWLRIKNSDPFTRRPMTMADVTEATQEGQLVQAWLLCKDLMKRSTREPTIDERVRAFVKACPEILRATATKSLDSTKNPYEWIDVWYSKFCTQLQQSEPPQITASRSWRDFYIETIELLHSTSKHSTNNYLGEMHLYVAKLFQLAENLDVFSPHLQSILSGRSNCAKFLEILNGNRQLLHILLGQAHAFSEENIRKTHQMAACMMEQTFYALFWLFEASSGDGFTGPMPPTGDAQEATALLYLYVRIHERNYPQVIRPSLSTQEYRAHIQQIRQAERVKLPQILSSIRVVVQQLVEVFKEKLLQQVQSLVQLVYI